MNTCLKYCGKKADECCRDDFNPSERLDTLILAAKQKIHQSKEYP
jgi:hypothetical protein